MCTAPNILNAGAQTVGEDANVKAEIGLGEIEEVFIDYDCLESPSSTVISEDIVMD